MQAEVDAWKDRGSTSGGRLVQPTAFGAFDQRELTLTPKPARTSSELPEFDFTDC